MTNIPECLEPQTLSTVWGSLIILIVVAAVIVVEYVTLTLGRRIDADYKELNDKLHIPVSYTHLTLPTKA